MSRDIRTVCIIVFAVIALLGQATDCGLRQGMSSVSPVDPGPLPMVAFGVGIAMLIWLMTRKER